LALNGLILHLILSNLSRLSLNQIFRIIILVDEQFKYYSVITAFKFFILALIYCLLQILTYAGIRNHVESINKIGWKVNIDLLFISFKLLLQFFRVSSFLSELFTF